MVTLNGKIGVYVRRRVVEEHVQEAGHAIILFHRMVVQTAHPWDLVRNLSLVISNLAKVRDDRNTKTIALPVD